VFVIVCVWQRRRVQQERERLAQEAETKRKVAAASFARQHLTGLVSNVFDTLVADGHFFDPLTREVGECCLD
jgi:Radial spoke protein 3